MKTVVKLSNRAKRKRLLITRPVTPPYRGYCSTLTAFESNHRAARKSLGAAWYLPQERQITTKDQLLGPDVFRAGWTGCREIVFGEISTGAQNDLERATKQAYAMVSIYGMSDKVGMLSYYDSTGQSDFSFTKPYSEKTAELIDAEVKDMISAAYERAKQLLSDHREQHRQVAELLIEREVIFSDDLENILGNVRGQRKRKHNNRKNCSGKAEGFPTGKNSINLKPRTMENWVSVFTTTRELEAGIVKIYWTRRESQP